MSVPVRVEPARFKEGAAASDEATTARDEAVTAREEKLETAHERTQALENRANTLQAEIDAYRQSQTRFELFEDRGGQFRWRLRHRNGNILSDGGEGYTDRSSARDAVQGVRRHAPNATVERVE